MDGMVFLKKINDRLRLKQKEQTKDNIIKEIEKLAKHDITNFLFNMK